jgi:cell wall-associated NlpC family hydrolase
MSPKTLTGRVAVVSSDLAIMRREYDPNSRVLSKVPKGTNLALVYEAGSFYGVLMSDSSVGWVSKNSVQMIDYQVSITPTPGSALAAAAASTDPDGNVPYVDGSSLPPALDTPPTNANLSESVPPRIYNLLQEAFTYMGVPYVWGGVSRSGLDCSGFVGNVFRSQGVSLPRVAADQAKVGELVDWADLAPGDRLYFDMGRKGRISHTGLYIGNGYFIHASTNHNRVDVDPLNKPNYLKALICARRSL